MYKKVIFVSSAGFGVVSVRFFYYFFFLKNHINSCFACCEFVVVVCLVTHINEK